VKISLLSAYFVSDNNNNNNNKNNNNSNNYNNFIIFSKGEAKGEVPFRPYLFMDS